MEKHYCDFCGKELNGRKGKFIEICKSYNVIWLSWNVLNHTQKDAYYNDELCKECYEDFSKCFEDWQKKRKASIIH